MKKLYTVNEVAEMLHVSPKTIRHWTQTGKIPYFKVGCLVRFEADQVDSFLKQHGGLHEADA